MMTKENSPIEKRARINMVDALRGFALMGLFIVHMVEYFELYWYKPEPGLIHDLVFFLFGGKAYGIFALLFGLSFYIIMDNYNRKGHDFRKRFLWRLALLWCFGYVHSLIYAGDILQLLAICGLILVLLHTLSTKWMYVFAFLFLVQVPAIAQLFKHIYFSDPGYVQPQFYSLMGDNFEVFAHGSFSELVQHNIWRGQLAKWAFFIESGRLWNIFGLMFVGVILGRNGFFEREKYNIKKLIIGLIIFSGFFVALTMTKATFTSSFSIGMPQWVADQLWSYYINLAVIGAGVLLFVLVYQIRLGAGLLSLWSPAGRMSLTLYLAQGFIFVPLYYGFGLAWYDSLGQLWSLVLGVIFWVVQMFLAAWWLKTHQYGPLEWVWRKGTHIRR